MIFHLHILQYSLSHLVCSSVQKTEYGTQRKIRNINLENFLSWFLCSLENAEFGHSILLFCRGWQRKVPGIMVPWTAIVLFMKSFV